MNRDTLYEIIHELDDCMNTLQYVGEEAPEDGALSPEHETMIDNAVGCLLDSLISTFEKQ